jgi:hypothetical protein
MRRFGLAHTALAAALLASPALADEAANPESPILPGSADTRFKVYGFVQVYGAYYIDQNLYDNGALIGGNTDPLSAATPGRQLTLTARTSRIGVTTTTPSIRLGDIVTRFELDFAKNNEHGGTPHFREASVQFGRWLFGHTYSNWIDLPAAASTVDFAGPVGQACNDTGKYTQVRYTFPVNQQTSLAISLERSARSHGKFFQGTDPTPRYEKNPSDSGTPAALGVTTLPDNRWPTVVGAWTYTDRWGHLGFRAMEQYYGAFTPGTAGTGQIRSGKWAGAAQLSGAVKVGKDKLVASVYSGQALGAYGINAQAAKYDPLDTVKFYRNFGWQAGYTHPWTDRVRSNLVAGAIKFTHDPSVVTASDIDSSNNYFVNTFVKLARNVELGMEYGYETLRTFGAGQVTRADGSTSDRNTASMVQVSLTASF